MATVPKSMWLAVLLSVWMTAVGVAGEVEKFDLCNELGAAQSEHLLQFAEKIAAKNGAWETDVRTQALSLAKKLCPASKTVSEALKAKPENLTAEERAANKAALAAIVEKEKEFEKAEAKLDGKAPVEPPPPPDNLRAEFEQLRCELALETLALAERLSCNPFSPVAPLRAQLLNRAGDCIGSPRGRYQRALKTRIDAARRAPFAPFQGTWKTDWGTLELSQNATVVTCAGEIKIQGQFDPREMILKGNYWKGQETGAFEWKLARDERSFDGTFNNPRAQPPKAEPIKGARTDAEAAK